MKEEIENSVTRKLVAFHLLAEANMSLNQSLIDAASSVHKNDELSDPKRGVLMTIHRHGPQTVPQIARKKKFSRQHILTLVNDFLKEGYVELVNNPDHKTSMLVTLTERGLKAVKEINRLEEELFSRLEIGIDVEEMKKAAETMQKVKGIFESRQWKNLLEEFNL